ncbi:MAG: type II toxin-antitoxin system VapC family toxin [Candidatus Omnitrophica bacterium]|nr:type II toxin-antitoxin system VapC family toxin [Candidatus Omnitrophota bacterium]
MTHVLDAYALTAYFEKESGYAKVQELLTEAASSGHPLLLSAVNWGEVFYVTYREHGKASADQIARLMDEFPIEVIPVDVPIAHQAAIYKATHKMSYADCLAAALARLRKATLVTGDKDFKVLENEIKVQWLH